VPSLLKLQVGVTAAPINSLLTVLTVSIPGACVAPTLKVAWIDATVDSWDRCRCL